jgi:hypothetical protein
MNTNRHILALSALSALALAACISAPRALAGPGSAGPQFGEVRVSSRCSDARREATCMVLADISMEPHRPSPNDPEFTQFSRPVITALRQAGYSVTTNLFVTELPPGTNTLALTNLIAPDVGVYLSYGVERGPDWRGCAVYRHWATLSAIDLRRVKQTPDGPIAIEVWRTEFESRDLNADLRAVFPKMIEAARPYLATETRARFIRPE